MSRSIFCASRILSISSSTTSSLRPSAYKLLRNTSTRKISSSSTSQNSSNHKSFSDRGLVIGLLTLTALIGFGFGTRSKENKPILEQNLSATDLSANLKTDLAEDTTLPNEKNENQQTAAGSSSDNESEQGGAFNPETGEINWDCPCLGGMAHGSCGEQFKAAFSCFVYSEQEPKGVECIEKFKLMQDCFKDHPDEYGPELADNDDPPNEEKGDLPPDSSEGEGSSASGSNLKQSEDRELTPNEPTSRHLDEEQGDRPTTSLSQLSHSHETSLNSPDSAVLKSVDVKPSPL